MSQFKKKLSAFTAMIAFLSLTGASAMANNYFVGQMDGKTNNMNLKQSGNRLDIENLGGKGAVGQVDWKSFNVGKGQHVNFGFNGLSQTIINRVLGGQQSNILGKLTSSCAGGGNCSSYNESGKVLFINPAGVLFGNGSMVDINSFTASTFDVKGAKNLSSLSKEALDKYQIDILNKMSPIASVRNDGTTGGTGYITLDSNYTQAFKEAGIKINNAAAITANGATFAKLNADGTISDGLNTNKTVAFVANNINYKDSLIRTGDLYNSKSGSNQYSMGNVKLITADGVTFGYNNQGYSNSTKSVAEDTKTNVTRNINIDNSGLGEKELAINSGEIQIINKTNAKNSNVKISNTLMKANKLINTTSGDIIIQSTHDIDIDNSRIHTANSKEINGTNNTEAQKGGKVTIKSTGDGNVNIDDSLILTASGTGATASTNNAGGALIASNGGNVNMSNTEVVAQGNTEIQAGKQVKLNNSFVYAKNLKDTANAKNIKITAGEKVNIHNSGLHAQKDIDIAAVTSDNKLTGEVIISSDLNSKGKSQTLIVANNNLSIQGANTKLDNAAVVYDTITFYGKDTTGQNNVTVANNSSFTQFNGKIGDDITLETNGNFTLDNATVKRESFKIDIAKDSKGEMLDDGTVNAAKYTKLVGHDGTVDAVNLNIKSTQGNVVVKNNTNTSASKDINLTATKGNVDVSDSKLTAGNDLNAKAGANINLANAELKANNNVNLTAAKNVTSDKSTLNAKNNVNVEATKGKLALSGNNITADKDINLKSYETITFGAQGAKNINIDNKNTIKAGKNIEVKSTNANINGEKTTMPTLTYGDRLTFNAKGDNTFTSENSLKSVNVDYIAGGANKFYTQDDIQFVNSSLKAPTNFVESGSDVVLNNLTIKQATANAKDTVTEIYANGNVTTNDVTGTAAADAKAATKQFPQSVSVTRTGKGKTTLDINKTKLKITTETVKDAKNPDNGSITLDVKNADNKDAGLELVAQNVAKLDKDPTGGNFKSGYYKSGTPKWDEKIEAKEGPEVHLNAVDDKVSITKIDTDKLTLNENDKFIAATDAPNGTPTITVKDKGGFNFDPQEEYDPEPENFGYTDTIESEEVDKDVKTTTDTKVGDEYKISSTTETYQTTEQVEQPIPGTLTTTYEKTTTVYGTDTTKQDTVTTTTKYTDKKHEITFDKDGNAEKFILVYDKTRTEVDVDVKDPVTTTATRVDENIVEVSKNFVEDCPDLETPELDPYQADSLINQVKLPREQVEISKTSKITDNTVDQTSNVMSAAAKVDLGQNATAEYSDNTTKDSKKESDIEE